jgi:hypothetical protein
MELLLNLVWMLLALPAWWLWRQRAKHRGPGSSGYQCLLVLACLVVLLFPVISASDDLSAMRAEMEESGPGAFSMRAAETGKSAPAVKGLHSAVMVVAGFALTWGPSRRHEPRPTSAHSLVAPSMEHGGRAPPSCIA